MVPYDKRFENLSYDTFRVMATDPSLSENEKIGFPEEFRAGFEESIFQDLMRKLRNLARESAKVLDIGSGRGPVPEKLASNAKSLNQVLICLDSKEMLSGLDDANGAIKIYGKFPHVPEISDYFDFFDVVLCYSVFQYILEDSSFTQFLDTATSLLAPGGELLIGDIPNQTMKKRFLSTKEGARYHRNYMKDDKDPIISPFLDEPGRCDDSIVLAILSRARAAGFHAFVLPQAPELPFASRREDILIVKP